MHACYGASRGAWALSGAQGVHACYGASRGAWALSGAQGHWVCGSNATNRASIANTVHQSGARPRHTKPSRIQDLRHVTGGPRLPTCLADQPVCPVLCGLYPGQQELAAVGRQGAAETAE